ncbi:MAG: acetyl-CoA carboxylase biotin carboxyl carrier protein subunit [Bacteroidales bacterium]|nr:acetyl-CoA carboxylase biotin carboxyl carrier protein subunit [Bacteroidales bacterium]
MSNEGKTGKKPRYKSLGVEGTRYKTHFTKKFENRQKWEVPDDRKLITFIPGVILKVKVKEGQKVKKGDSIVILEAMKMQNRITIHRNGVIKNIHIKEGQRVMKGMLLMELN